METKDKFLKKVHKTSGCWVWTGAVDHGGYGVFKLDGRSVYAHRLAYTLENGPIPAGLEIDHLCRNRACVNPTHLEAVTRQENNARRPKSPNWGRTKRARKEIIAILRSRGEEIV